MYLTSHIFTKQIGFEICAALLRRRAHTKAKVTLKDVKKAKAWLGLGISLAVGSLGA